jgi:hypothetical protein
MDLINLELGKWLYLVIYAFFPATILLYLIHTYGLNSNEKPAEAAQKHIEQANYWADIALKTIQSGSGSKSVASLVHTIQRNLEEAVKILETAVLTTEQYQSLTNAYENTTAKFYQIQKSGLARNHSTPILPLTR